MESLGAGEIRKLATKLNLHPSKALGQNFVIDGNTCRKIVKLSEINASESVLEIGPGLGSLTVILLKESQEVIAVEIDKRLAEQLPLTLQENFPELRSKLTVINMDALNLTTLTSVPTALVANLPYNVSVPVLLHLLAHFHSITHGIVMVQAEVAERLAACPGSKSYGVPTVKLHWWASAQIAGSISREVFWPMPNVDSLLLAFKRVATPGNEELRAKTFTLIDAAFSQRRKMLRSSLGRFLGSSENAAQKLVEVGIDPTQRAEQLQLSEFIAIAERFLD